VEMRIGLNAIRITAEAAAGGVSVPDFGKNQNCIEKIEHFGFVLPVMQL